jgi:hypothetical protein
MKVAVLDEDPAIAAFLNEYEQHWFTTVVPRGYVEGGTAVALVSFGSELERIGRVDRTRPAATQKDGVRCTDLVTIEPPVSFDDLRAEMPANARTHLGHRTLPPETGSQALAALARLRPHLSDTIRRLRTDRSGRARREPGFDTVAMEKDAIGIAIDIFDGERGQLARWQSPAVAAQPFLAGLPEATLREDQMIVHDAGIFGDWDVVKRSAIGSVRFQSGDRSLTVINVNRTAIERALGVDLVYYNDYFDAFVLVQYKRMADSRNGGWLYRPDGNHETEVKRMEAIPSLAAEPLDALNYRLNAGACFFKLCESVVFDPDATALLRGMYLPLEYLAACKESAKGPLGGPAFGYSTVPRHLTNTSFVQLVQDGWIGSAGAVSRNLRAFVAARVRDGRSVMLAVGTGRPPRRARR